MTVLEFLTGISPAAVSLQSFLEVLGLAAVATSIGLYSVAVLMLVVRAIFVGLGARRNR